jgi:DNA-binding CsgD family transcriptional regulator
VGVIGEIHGLLASSPNIQQLFSIGWKNAASHEHWQEFVDTADAHDDPIGHAVLEELDRDATLVTKARHELIPDRQWRASVHYNGYRKVDGVDECLYSYQLLPALGADVVQVVEIHRSAGEARFSGRDSKLVDWLHREIGPMIGRQLASAGQMSFSQLPPRLQQVLQGLLEGDSEKQIAARLGLSRATAHEYIQSIYRRCGVGGRNELMARWIRLG